MKYSFNKSLLTVLTLLVLTFNAFGVTSVYALKSWEDSGLSLPDAPIVTAPPAFTNDTTPTIRGEAVEDSWVNVWYVDDFGALIQICQNVRVDDDEQEDKFVSLENEIENWSCNSSKVLPERKIELAVNATDEAGNTSADTSYFFTVDVTAPDAQIGSQPPNPSNSPDATFTFSSTDATVTFECQLDGGGFSACTSPKNYTGLANGSHTFEVRANDAAGNLDTTPASYTWMVNTSQSGGPEIQVLDGLTDIPDGTGMVSFGTTPPGTPIMRTFTVTNTGTANLTLTEPISVPTGFSLVSSFSSLTLAPGASTSFQVRLDGMTLGNYSGEVSFENSDADENPFNFAINGMVTNTVVGPTVTSILRAGADPTSAASVDYTVTFSESVTNVDSNDFAVAATCNIVGATVGTVTGSGDTYTVTVNTGSESGTLRLDVPDTVTITDLTANPLVGLPFISGQAYTIVKAYPLVKTAPRSINDFDGDGKTDPTKLLPNGEVWWLRSSTCSWDGTWLGADTFTYVSGSDFDGDGKTDPAKFYASTGIVWWLQSSAGTWSGVWLGGDTFTYVSGSDFDGDGKADPAKFYASTGIVWWLKSSTGTWDGVWLGGDTFTYVSGSDFDGDGKTDPAKFYPGTGSVWWLKSSTGTWDTAWLGSDAFTYVSSSDFDGDGKTDPAKFYPGTSLVWWLKSSTGTWDGVWLGGDTFTYVWGSDFDGDGKTDAAKFYPDTGTVWWLKSSTGSWDGKYLGSDTYLLVN